MFTGIITNLGVIEFLSDGLLKITIDSNFSTHLVPGMSVSVNGICLTVRDFSDAFFTADYMPETSRKTNLGYSKVGDKVNLEMPATPTTFLAGHVVQGHVDTVAQISDISTDGNSSIFKFNIDPTWTRLMVDKGSITVNGISLTIIEAGKDYFTVGIIPHTLENTMLHTANVGSYVNIETDVLAKYMAKLIANKND